MKPRTVKLPKGMRVFKFVRWYMYDRVRARNSTDYYLLDQFFGEVIFAATYRRKFNAPR